MAKNKTSANNSANTTDNATMNTILCFNISRYNSDENIINFQEYFSAAAQRRIERNPHTSEIAVKSLGRLMAEPQYQFISGLWTSIVLPDGEVRHSVDRMTEQDAVTEDDKAFASLKMDVNISLDEEQVTSIISQVLEIEAIEEPRIDGNGVSQLRGYQLQVELNDPLGGTNKSNGDEKYPKIVNYYYPHQVDSVKVVASTEANYVAPKESEKVNLLHVVDALVPKKEVRNLSSLEDTKSFLLKRTRSQTRAENRKKHQAARDAAKEGFTPVARPGADPIAASLIEADCDFISQENPTTPVENQEQVMALAMQIAQQMLANGSFDPAALQPKTEPAPQKAAQSLDEYEEKEAL